MKRSALILVGLSVLGTMTLASPRLTADPEVYDFGAVMDGVVVQHQVTLTNTGTSILNVSRVDYNCACTSYTFPNNARSATVAPGQSVAMTVRFNTTNYSRYPQPVSQTLTIQSNDPTRPHLPIVVRGQVRALAAHEGAPSALYNDYYVLVDLHPAEIYAQGHLLGAMNIPFAQLQARLGELPRTKVIYLYDATGIEAVQAAQLLQRNGFLLPRAISGGIAGWWLALEDMFFVWAPSAVRTVPTGISYYGTSLVVDPTRFARGFQYVVDLRSPEAYAAGRFPGADNVFLPTAEGVAAWAATLPRPRTGTSLAIWIVDEDGSQACSVAQYLQSVGFSQARCVLGGIAAWRDQFEDELLFPQP